MQRKWFKWVRNVENAERRWKKLALQYHPDRPGGSDIIMSEINAEYQWILVELQRSLLPVVITKTEPAAPVEPPVIVATVVEDPGPKKEKFLKDKHTSKIKDGVKTIGWALFDAFVDNVERKYRER